MGVLQKLVEKLKKERFRAIYTYLCRGEPGTMLNLVKTAQVGCLPPSAVPLLLLPLPFCSPEKWETAASCAWHRSQRCAPSCTMVWTMHGCV